MLTYTEAKARGFAVDSTCYPWIAYKGARFAPTDVDECYTARESSLQEQVRTLERDLEIARTGKRPEYKAPPEWKLQPTEAALFQHLLTKPECTTDDIANALWPGDEDFTRNRLSVFTCKLRAKLKPRGIKIRTLWGAGLALENRTGVKAMLRAGGTALQ